MRNKIRLLGMNDVQDFLYTIRNVEGRIELFNSSHGYKVSGHSLLGVAMAMSEWGDDIWIESEDDIYFLIEKYIVMGEDSVAIHN